MQCENVIDIDNCHEMVLQHVIENIPDHPYEATARDDMAALAVAQSNCLDASLARTL